ncbi:TadE family type IV pilus minor pilin [Solwaraspora sp. WMMB335]|uniref:TadE family type IV pilus minor pilin n=1 Tax=Solwaraspora sp. WMMB335 TaxID=3404118 RepID=UPI003B93720D
MTRRRWAGRDRGSFTAELAAGLPALMLLMVVGLTAVRAVVVKAECVDLARGVALAVARGEPSPYRTLPVGTRVSIAVDGDLVTVTVHAPVLPAGVRLPAEAVSATATAAVEPGSIAPVAVGAPAGLSTVETVGPALPGDVP